MLRRDWARSPPFRLRMLQERPCKMLAGRLGAYRSGGVCGPAYGSTCRQQRVAPEEVRVELPVPGPVGDHSALGM
eukprot:15438107-Alexandrium_andersonii.AAC.1